MDLIFLDCILVFYLLVELLKYSHCLYSEVLHNEGLMQVKYLKKSQDVRTAAILITFYLHFRM